MSNFIYTDIIEDVASSVISNVYYNRDNLEIVFELHSGALAGYRSVNEDVFAAVRVESDSPTGSVGRYWNEWFRNKTIFPGLDTRDIDDFKEFRSDAYVPITAQSFTTSSFSWPVTTTNTLSIVEPAKSEYTVAFDTEDTEDGEVQLLAVSQDDALVRFNQIAEIAGWGVVTVTALTRHF